MTLTRIYIPLNAPGLRSLGSDGAIGDAPFLAHAVTEAVRAAASTAGQDEWEYTALNDAAQSSASLLTPGERRLIVAAADVKPDLVGSAPGGPTVESAVSLAESVELSWIASFHVDDDDGSEDDELLWYDVTELPFILALL